MSKDRLPLPMGLDAYIEYTDETRENLNCRACGAAPGGGHLEGCAEHEAYMRGEIKPIIVVNQPEDESA